MSEWKECKLLELADKFAMGPFGSNIKAENFVNAGVPVIRGTNLNYHRFVDGEFVFLTEEKANELKTSNCFPGDIVFTHRGTIGQVGLIPNNKYPRYVISQSGMKVTVNSKLLDNNFLFYFFKSEKGQYELLQHESQVGVPSISNPLTSLKSVSVPLPPLPEQKAISSVLSSLDDKIDLLNRQNKTLEAMAEALFRQWFVEEAEEGWENQPLRFFGEIITGKTPSKNNPEFWGEDYHFITPTDFKNFGMFTNRPQRHISAIGWKAMNRLQLPAKSILVTCIGSDMGKIVLSSQPCITNQQINSIILKDNRYLGFIYEYLKNQYDLLRSIALGGTTMPIINKSEFSNICVQCPPLQLIVRFHDLWDINCKKIFDNQKQIHILQKLRDTLLPKLMSGEVRVSV